MRRRASISKQQVLSGCQRAILEDRAPLGSHAVEERCGQSPFGTDILGNLGDRNVRFDPTITPIVQTKGDLGRRHACVVIPINTSVSMQMNNCHRSIRRHLHRARPIAEVCCINKALHCGGEVMPAALAKGVPLHELAQHLHANAGLDPCLHDIAVATKICLPSE